MSYPCASPLQARSPGSQVKAFSIAALRTCVRTSGFMRISSMLNPLPELGHVLRHVGAISLFLADTVKEMGEHMLGRRFPFRIAHFFAQADRAGVGSVPLIALISFF